MNDGRDDHLGGNQFGSGAVGRQVVGQPSVDERARAQVRALRDGVIPGGGERVVAGPPREEMRENARPTAEATPGSAPLADPPLPAETLAATTAKTSAETLAFERHLKPLTARQLTAIGLLTAGKTIVAAARSIGVDPGTVHRWKATSPLFAAELNSRQAALFDGIVVKLRLTMMRAVDELHAMTQGPSKRDRQDVAWRLLPMLRPAKLVVPGEPTSARALLDAQLRAAQATGVEGEFTDEDRLALVLPDDRVI